MDNNKDQLVVLDVVVVVVVVGGGDGGCGRACLPWFGHSLYMVVPDTKNASCSSTTNNTTS